MHNPYHKPFIRNQKIILGLTLLAVAVTGAAAIITALGLLFHPFKMWWQGIVIVVLFGFALVCWSVIMACRDVFREMEGER